MCDRCSCVFVAPCRVLNNDVMLCKECAMLYGAVICSGKVDMAWARTVSEWNKAQIWKDDLYGIPKKGGEYYADVKEMMEASTHKKTVDRMMGKEPEKTEVKPKVDPEPDLKGSLSITQLDMIELQRQYNRASKKDKKEMFSRVENRLNLLSKRFDELKKTYEENYNPADIADIFKPGINIKPV